MTKHSGLRAFRAQCYAMAAIGATLAFAALAPAAQADSNSARVRLTGSVRPVCTVDGGSRVRTPVTVGNINEPNQTAASYVLNCNAPFAYEVTSQYGGLRRQGGAGGWPSGIPVRGYTLDMTIPTDGAAISVNCASNTLIPGSATCGTGDSGAAIAINKTAALRVAWGNTPQLPAGTYADRITFVVRLQQ